MLASLALWPDKPFQFEEELLHLTPNTRSRIAGEVGSGCGGGGRPGGGGGFCPPEENLLRFPSTFRKGSTALVGGGAGSGGGGSSAWPPARTTWGGRRPKRDTQRLVVVVVVVVGEPPAAPAAFGGYGVGAGPEGSAPGGTAHVAGLLHGDDALDDRLVLGQLLHRRRGPAAAGRGLHGRIARATCAPSPS